MAQCSALHPTAERPAAGVRRGHLGGLEIRQPV